MTRAEAAVMRIQPDQEPPETSYVQAGLVETQHADALRTLGDLTAARAYAQQSVDAAAHSHARGRVHRLATLATVLAGQGDVERAASTAIQMLDQATGMESRRIQERIISVHEAINSVSDGHASADLTSRPGILAGMRWTVHSEKPLYEDEWLDIRLADVELPDGRHLEHRLIRTPPGAGCVMVKDGRVLLLWRHRFITDTWGWEIPVGRIDPGEHPAYAAARETEEETGWRPGPLTPLLRVEPTPGISDSVHHIYLADGAERIGLPEDDFESDHVSWVPLADIPALISRGEISTGTTLAALLYTLTS